MKALLLPLGDSSIQATQRFNTHESCVHHNENTQFRPSGKFDNWHNQTSATFVTTPLQALFLFPIVDRGTGRGLMIEIGTGFVNHDITP